MEGRLAGGVAPWFFCGRAQWGAPASPRPGSGWEVGNGGIPSHSSPGSRALPVLTCRRAGRPRCSKSPAYPRPQEPQRDRSSVARGTQGHTSRGLRGHAFPWGARLPARVPDSGLPSVEDPRQPAPLRERSRGLPAGRSMPRPRLGIRSIRPCGDGPQLSTPLFPAAFERISWHT